MENEENQNQVSLRFPPPLEIAPRFPQSHNPDDDSPLPKTQNQKARKEPQRLKKPQPPSSGSSFDEKMLRGLRNSMPLANYGDILRVQIVGARHAVPVLQVTMFCESR